MNWAGNAWPLGQGRRISSSQRSRRRSDGLAAGKVRESAHRDRLDRPPDTRAAFGEWDAQEPVQQTLLVARIQQGVSRQLIENRPEQRVELFAIDLDQDRLPVLGFLTRLARRLTGCRRILFLAETTDRGGKAPLQPGRLVRAVIERFCLGGDLVCGPVAVDGNRGLTHPGSDAALAGAGTVLAELIERVTQIDQSPGSAERLMLSLPQHRAQGDFDGGKLGDQLWTPEGMEVRLIHCTVIDVGAVFQPASRECRGINWVGGGEAVDDRHGRRSAPWQVGRDAAPSRDRKLAYP